MTANKQKTPAKIRDQLIRLLEKMPLDDISVTALCAAANINRATFYYHYNSIQDVFNEIESVMESEFDSFLSHSAMSDSGEPEKSFYVMLFEFVERNSAICRMILNSPHIEQTSFLTRAIERGRSKVTEMMTTHYPGCSREKIDYYYMFVSHGFLGLLGYWLNSGMRESVGDIAEIGEKVSYMGIKYLTDGATASGK